MTKEQAIKHTQDFEAELTALAKRYNLSSYNFIAYLGNDTSNSYPMYVHWVAQHVDLKSKQPLLMKAAFMAAVNTLRLSTGKNLIHEEYHGGFDHKKKP